MESLYPSIETVLAFGATFGVIILIIVMIAVTSSVQKKRRLKNKEDFPEKLMVSLGDSFYTTLQRRWYQGQWVYIYFGKPPYAHRSPESREERGELEIPECLKDTPEEETLRRFDELTKPGGVMGEVIKAAYSTPEAIDRQRLSEEIGRIVREK